MKQIRRFGSWFVDYPTGANAVILASVVLHVVLANRWPDLDIAGRLADAALRASSDENLISLALGAASIAAMVGGFAGVVVIFGLGAEYDRFRVLRQRGGRRLRASWISVVLVSLSSAFASVMAAVVVVAFDASVGMWIFEAALLFSAHGAVRLTWLLARLAKLVDAADEDARLEAATASLSSIFRD